MAIEGLKLMDKFLKGNNLKLPGVLNIDYLIENVENFMKI